MLVKLDFILKGHSHKI